MKKLAISVVLGLAFGLSGSPFCRAEEGPGDSTQTGATSPGTPGVRPSSAHDKTPALPLSDIKLEFKLDPRLTKSLYMGDRWVSPPTFTQVGVEHAKQVIVEAVAHVLDAKGRPLNTRPNWVAADPGVATITRSQGNGVRITVTRVGETTVEVVSQGLSKKISIKAVSRGPDTLQADITPLAVTRRTGVEAHVGDEESTKPNGRSPG